MMRRRKLAGPMIMDLDNGDLLRTQPLAPKETMDDTKTTLKQTITENKRFLQNVLKYANPNLKLPEQKTHSTVEDSLKTLNIRLTNIASSKEILADYEKHFRALHIFFQKIMQQGKQLAEEQVIIWRTFFLNNMAVIAFNNGDYTTSMDILKQILERHNKKQIRQPVFTLVITNLSAIYHKMKSWDQSFSYLQKAFQFSKKLMDSSSVTQGNQRLHQINVNSILAIQCIMMIKKKNAIQKSNHNPKQIQKLMIKLVKETNKLTPDGIDIPYIDKYLEQKKLTDIKEAQSSVAGSKAGSYRSKRKHYPLQTISHDTTRDYPILPRQSRSDNIELQLNSPAKRYHLNQMRQQIDQLNQKVNKMQIQQQLFYTSLKQLIELIKIKNITNSLQTTNKEGLLINKLDSVLQKSQIASKVVFKTLQVEIWFTEQGIKLKTFTKLEENLSWGELQNIFKLLQLFHLYYPYLELSPTRHTIAWILSKYLTVSNRIKIKKLPWAILVFKYQGTQYGLYHIRERQFSINGSDFQPIIFQMCEKSFNYYFNTYKVDEYEAQCLSYFSSQELKKKKEQYFLQVIRLKQQVKGSTVQTGGTFQIDFSQDFHDIFGNLKVILKQTNNRPSTYKRVKLWFDETASDSNNFLGVFYLVYQNNDTQQLQFRLYTLNNFQGVNITEPVVKILSFSEIENRYSFSLSESSSITLNNLYKSLIDTISLRTQAIKREGKTRYIIHNIVHNTQCIYFQQRMLLKKYYRPLFIYVLRTKSRFIGIRFSCFNQFKIITYNITVLINFYINKKQQQKQEQMEMKFKKIKQRVSSEFISKMFNQMETIMEQQKVMHLEQFVSLIQAQNKS